jgi:hypothetical protein
MIQQIIPDIHGRSVSDMKAKKVKSILLGDYWDSFDIPFEKQVESFYEWMKFAEQTDSICLIGNHDEHYLNLSQAVRGSGFQEDNCLIIKHLLESFKDQLQYGYYENGVLYTHAGITDDYILKLEERFGWIEDLNLLVEIINSNPELNSYISHVNGGSDRFDGPLWLRPKSYYPPKLLLENYINQVAGHTYSRNNIRQYHNLHIVDIGRAIDLNELNLYF